MLADFKNSFAVGLSSKVNLLATRLVSYFPPHLKRVTTLPCEIQMINNTGNNALDVFNTIISMCGLLNHTKCSKSKCPSLA